MEKPEFCKNNGKNVRTFINFALTMDYGYFVGKLFLFDAEHYSEQKIVLFFHTK